MSKPIPMTVGGLMLILLATQATLAQGEAERWQQKFFNPKPDSDDLMLPMPCGGAMAFRPIAVAVENLLSDQEVRLGDSREALAYAEGTRPAFISAAIAATGLFNSSSIPGASLSFSCPSIADWQDQWRRHGFSVAFCRRRTENFDLSKQSERL